VVAYSGGVSATLGPDSPPEQLWSEVEALRARVADLEAAGERLEASDERLRGVLDAAHDAIFVIDPAEDAILDCNRRAADLLGFTREELLSLPVSFVHPQEMERVQAFAREVYREGRGWTDALTCRTKAGRRLAAEMSASVTELGGRPAMIAFVRDVTEERRLRAENALLQEELRGGRGEVVAASAAMEQVLEQVALVAPTEASVLVTGESGTGKELIARAIHEQSPRRARPLVRINCASVPAGLFESEFFGHAKGAFTGALRDRPGRFEVADGGTLFLDEVGEIPLEQQAKLLRVLQEGQLERVGETRTRSVDVRVVAATNRDLAAAAAEGRFRLDLLHRLSVFPVDVPPLRERPEDVELLARVFVARAADRLGIDPPALAPDEVAALEAADWPGNVRELQNVVERAVILATRSGRLELARAAGLGPQSPPAGPSRPAAAPATLADLERLEREIVARALEETGGKVYGDDGAAARLGLKPTTLAYRLKKLGLRP